MSETPSKLRQPRKLSAKIDLDALNEGRFDPTLIENLKIDQPAALANVIEADLNAPAGDSIGKKRKPQSPARNTKFSLTNGPTMTSVPRRNPTLSGQPRPSSIFKPKSSVFPQAAPIVRKPISSSISSLKSSQQLQQLAAEEEISKAKIRELEQVVEKLTLELAEHSKHQNDLKGQLSESERRVNNLDAFRKNLESRVNNKEEENSRYEMEIERLRKQIENEREEASNYSSRIKGELNDQIKSLQEAKGNVEHELRNCRASLQSVEDELTNLKSTLNRQSSTVLDLESQIAALKAKLQAAQTEIISRSLQCDDLTNKLAEAHKLIEDLKTKLQEGNKR